MSHVIVVHKFWQIAILDTVFHPHVLMLMVVVLAKLCEAHGGKSLLIEGIMIATAQITIQSKDEHRFQAHIIATVHVRDISRQLTGARIALSSQTAYPPHILLGSGGWHPFREHTHDCMILLRTLVPAHNIVIENGLDIPSLILGHFREVVAAVQSLFFSRHRQENNRSRELQLAQHTRALETHRGSACVIVRSRSIAIYIERIAVP